MSQECLYLLNLLSDSEEEIISKAFDGKDEIQALDNEGKIRDPALNLIGRDSLIWYKVPFVQPRSYKPI